MNANEGVPEDPDSPDSLREIACSIADATSWLRFMAILGFVSIPIVFILGFTQMASRRHY